MFERTINPPASKTNNEVVLSCLPWPGDAGAG
jgi:hypothetical protein